MDWSEHGLTVMGRPIEEVTDDELRDIAKRLGCTIISTSSRAEIIFAILDDYMTLKLKGAN
jgi:hypothetical protein